MPPAEKKKKPGKSGKPKAQLTAPLAAPSESLPPPPHAPLLNAMRQATALAANPRAWIHDLRGTLVVNESQSFLEFGGRSEILLRSQPPDADPDDDAIVRATDFLRDQGIAPGPMTVILGFQVMSGSTAGICMIQVSQ